MRPEACAAAGEALQVETAEATPDATIRAGEMEGALQVVGEAGYREASVRAVLEYSGSHRRQFYEHFDSLEDCFQQAYVAWVRRLGAELLEVAVAAAGWRGALRAGLLHLAELVEGRPAIARSLFVEVQVAGGAALAEHEQAVERLAAALDSVRGEIDEGEQPPPSTGVFVAGGIEACLADVLGAGDPARVWEALPELMHMAVGSYLGDAAAAEEFERTHELLARRRAEREGEAR